MNTFNDGSTIIDTMVLTNKYAPATISSGRNMTLNVDAVSNEYSLISASGNIHLAVQTLNNESVDIIEVTTAPVPVYVQQVSCRSSWGRTYCNTTPVYAGTTLEKTSKVGGKHRCG